MKVQCPLFDYVAFPFDKQRCFLVWHTLGFPQIKINSSVIWNTSFQNENPNIHYAIDYKQIPIKDGNSVLQEINTSLESEDVSFAAGIEIHLSRYVFPYMW